jgi:2'-5' RNA ligase
MNNDNLYFFALIPPKEIYEAIEGFKNDFAARFASKRALKVMPHITIKTPFIIPVSEHEKLLNWFQKLPVQQTKFEIELKNFGAFAGNSPVVFVHPVMNASLSTFQTEIIRSFKNLFPHLVTDFDLKFHPHMTIAYRDLSFEKFQDAWKEYRTKVYRAIFTVENIYLLQHDRKQWNIISTHPLD